MRNWTKSYAPSMAPRHTANARLDLETTVTLDMKKSCIGKVMRRNIDPHIWGGHAWRFLEACAAALDDRGEGACYESYKQLIALLPEVLPCAQCREHCKEYLREYPLPPARDIMAWLREFREAVKRRKEMLRQCNRRPKRSLTFAVCVVAWGAIVAAMLITTCVLFLRS